MKAAERWERYRYYLDHARSFYEAGKVLQCDQYLLLAAEAIWTAPASRKQVAQRKLASELWQLAGALGAVRQIQSGWSSLPAGVPYCLGQAIDAMYSAEVRLRKAMKEIK